MKNACKTIDPHLLALVHGDLRGSDALRTRAHLALCPACRARLRRHAALSGCLATEFRNPRLGRLPLGRTSIPRWTAVGVVLAVFLFFGWVVSHDVAVARGAFAATSITTDASAPHTSGHCAEDDGRDCRPPGATKESPYAFVPTARTQAVERESLPEHGTR